MQILSLENSYKTLCSHFNKSQNNMIPPNVFDDFYNLVTNFILDEGAKKYGNDQDVVDLLRPFTVTKIVSVSGGTIPLPKDYRRLLSIGVYTSKDGKSNCNCESNSTDSEDENCDQNDPLDRTLQQQKEANLKKQCNIVPVTEVNINEWDKRTQSSYKFPTMELPIACVFYGDKIRICPYDISNVEIRYLRHPKTYKYGYTKLPDDTFKFDLNTSTESEWELNAMQYIFKGLSHLYADYAKDTEMIQSVLNLQKIGIFA